MSGDQSWVYVGVFDHEGNHVENAKVRLQPEAADGEAHCLAWDRSRGCYVAFGIIPGRYRLIARAPNYDPSERSVDVEGGGWRTIIVLGLSGLPFLFRGQVKTPFQPQPDLFAIALDDHGPQDSEIQEIVAATGLQSEFLNWNGQPPRHVRVFRFPPDVSPGARAEVEGRWLLSPAFISWGRWSTLTEGRAFPALPTSWWSGFA